MELSDLRTDNTDTILMLLACGYRKISEANGIYNTQKMQKMDLTVPMSRSAYIASLCEVSGAAEKYIEGSDALFRAMNITNGNYEYAGIVSNWDKMNPIEKEEFDRALNEKYRELFRVRGIDDNKDNSIIMSDMNVHQKLTNTLEFLALPQIALLTDGIRVEGKTKTKSIGPDLDFLNRFSNATIKHLVVSYLYSGSFREIQATNPGREIFDSFVDLHNAEEERIKKIIYSYSSNQIRR